MGIYEDNKSLLESKTREKRRCGEKPSKYKAGEAPQSNLSSGLTSVNKAVETPNRHTSESILE